MNKLLVTLGVCAAILGGAFTHATTVDAYRGDPSAKGPSYTAERHEALEKVFDTNDYNAWKNLMPGRGRVTQVINKDNFAKFAQAHKLAEAGKLDEAAKIRQELDLNLRNGAGQGMGMRRLSK
jgi:hypothetical protein